MSILTKYNITGKTNIECRYRKRTAYEQQIWVHTYVSHIREKSL